MFVLDTNIVIEFTHDNPEVVFWFHNLAKKDETFFISVLSVTELLGYHNLPDKEKNSIIRFLGKVFIVEVNIALAKMAARLRSKYGKIQTVDSIIAATAISLGTPLVSKDKVFNKISEISVTEP